MVRSAAQPDHVVVPRFRRFARVLAVAATICAVLGGEAHADTVCVHQSDISKWEVLGIYRLLAHQGSRYLAFLTLDRTCPAVRPGHPVELRFFSPSICPNDVVKVNGTDCRVRDVEPVRKH